MKAERDALQDRVLPKVRAHCEAHGFRFELIDLRWGVNQEAGLDQRTMQICLEELANCKAHSLRPNFIIFIGERYGWRPLPTQIEAEEFEQLMTLLSSGQRARLQFDEAQPELLQGEGNGWYRRDENAIPPAYVLMPRHPGSVFEDRENWGSEEAYLHQLLRDVATKLFSDPPNPRRAKYFQSATHQEVELGLFSAPEASDNVFAYLLEEISNQASEEDAAIRFLKEQIAERLPENQLYRYSRKKDEVWLNELCRRVESDLIRVINEEIAQVGTFSEVEIETTLHRSFAQDRVSHFVGRQESLNSIADYIVSRSTNPLFVHGCSGSGKTTLLAQAWFQAEQDHSEAIIVSRFIGASPGSDNLESLLTDLCQQIEPHFEAHGEEEGDDAEDGSHATNLNRLTTKFGNLLKEVPNENKLILFLDAVDQLTDSMNEHALFWLPRQIPESVSLIISALHRPNETAGRASQSAKQHFQHASHLDLPTLEIHDGEILLRTWLASAGRSLTVAQEAAVLAKFQAQGSPLWLRLVLDQAKRWRSFDPVPETIPIDTYDLISTRIDELRQDKNHGEVLVTQTLGYLNASRNGLTTTELLDVLARDEACWTEIQRQSSHELVQRQVPLVYWTRLHDELDVYLTERQADGTTLHTIYHRVIAEWIEAQIPANAYHDQLATYFADQSLYIGEGQHTSPLPNLRLLNELVYQQIEAERWDDVVGDEDAPGPLTDLRFVLARCQAGMHHELTNDYNTVLAALPELEEERRQEKIANERCREYGAALAEYARRSQDDDSLPLPEPPASVPVSKALKPDDDEESTHPVESKPSRAETLQQFSSFFAAHQHLLTTEYKHLFSIARNYAESGAVVEHAELLLKGRSAMLRASRPSRQPLHPACRLVLEGHQSIIRSAVLSADGQRALSGSWDNTLRVWDTQTGACMEILAGHSGSINSVAWSTDEKWALSGGYDRTLRFWDVENGICLKTLEGHNEKINAIDLSPDGRWALSGSDDCTLRLWDTETGACVSIVEESYAIHSVAISANGKRALSGTTDFRFWDIKSGTSLATIEAGDLWAKSLDLSPSGEHALICFNSHPRLFDTGSKEQIATLLGHMEVDSVALSHDGLRALSGGGVHDQTLHVWDVANKECSAVLVGHSFSVESVSLNADGRYALSSSSRDLYLWDLAKGTYIKSPNSTGKFDEVAFSCNGKMAISILSAGTHITERIDINDRVLVWDPQSRGISSQLKEHSNWVRAVALSANGDLAVVGSDDLRIWDTETEQCLFVCKGHSDFLTSVALNADGSRALSGSTDETVRFWNTHTGDCLAILEGHSDDVRAVDLSADGRRALSGSEDHTLRLWDTESGSCLVVFEGHTRDVRAVALSADGRRALSSSYDDTTRLWDTASGACLCVMEEDAKTVILSPDGSRALTGSDFVKYWDTETGTCLCLHHPNSSVAGLHMDWSSSHAICATASMETHNLTILESKMETDLLWETPSNKLESNKKKRSAFGWLRGWFRRK